MKYLGLIIRDRFLSKNVGYKVIRWIEVLCLIAFGIGHGWATPLRAAVAKINITPPPGVQMWGFSSRKSAGTGTLDPLYARVLVLDASGKRLALVSVDLG